MNYLEIITGFYLNLLSDSNIPTAGNIVLLRIVMENITVSFYYDGLPGMS